MSDSIKIIIKLFIPPILNLILSKFNLSSYSRNNLPDKKFYKPLFQAWLFNSKFRDIVDKISDFTLVSEDRLWIIFNMVNHSLNVKGAFWECGVYKGGTAKLIAELISKKGNVTLRIFDTFEGMPETNTKFDYHLKGDFSNTSFQSIKNAFSKYNFVDIRKGFIPKSFSGLENEKIAFAHIDVDIYSSVKNCCEFIYPKLEKGGVMIFDDYGFPSCPGARRAVDEYFRNKNDSPIILNTGQAIVLKSV